MIYICGIGGNSYSRGILGMTVGSEDSNFPKAALFDNFCDVIYREAAAGTDRRIYGDLSILSNGTFEVDLAGWTVETSGTGAAARTTTGGEFHGGVAAVECTGGSGFGQVVQDVFARPGELLRYDIWARIVTAGTARFRIQNRATGNYWVSGAWQSAVGDAATTTSTSFVNLTGNVTVENFAKVQDDFFPLRITLRHDNASGSACFDDLAIFPHTNFLGVFGHNIPASPLITPKFQTSPDASSWTTQATMTMKQPAFYSYLSTAQTARYVGLLLEGTGLDAHYIGELFAGYGVTPGRAMKWNYSTPHEYAAIRHETAIGRVWAARMSEKPMRGLSFSVRAGTEIEANEWIEDFWQRSLGGEWPVVVVPVETEFPVYHGRVMPSLGATRGQLTSWAVPLDLTPSAMPIVGQ